MMCKFVLNFSPNFYSRLFTEMHPSVEELLFSRKNAKNPSNIFNNEK